MSTDFFCQSLALAETDRRGFADFLHALNEAASEQLAAIYAAVGTAVGTALGAAAGVGAAAGSWAGPVGALVGAAIGIAVGAIIVAIRQAAQDEIFEPQLAAIELPNRTTSIGNSGQTPTETFSYYGFGGQYQVEYNWAIA